MANQTVWYRANPGQTLYAFPLNQDIADWATYSVSFTEKGDGGGWYSVVVNDAFLDWAIFDTVPASWDESEYASIHLEVSASGSLGQAPYYPTVSRSIEDENPIFFSWATNTPLTAQVAFNGGSFSATTGTITFNRAIGSLFLFQLSYDENDRPTEGVAEYAITDGSDTFYLPLNMDIGSTSGLVGPRALTVTVDDGTDPIQSAQVRVYKTGATETKLSDASGQAIFGVADSTWSILVTANGFSSAATNVVVSGDTSVTISLTAEPPAVLPPDDPALCAIAAYVYLNGKPVENARVRAKLIDTNQTVEGILLSTQKDDELTDREGLAVLELVRLDQFTNGDGEYKIEASHNGRILWEKTITVPNSSTANLEDL